MTVALWAGAAASIAGAAAILLVRSRRRNRALQLAGSGALGGAARRTAVVWAVLAGGLVALLVAFVLEARPQPAGASILPPRTSAVIVVDLSSSMRASSKRIAEALLDLPRPGRRLGLVVFSDTAYEALPLSTPAESLRSWLQLFETNRPALYPWTPSFSGGTWISSGLVVARRMLRQAGVADGHVLLVSDLVDGPSDLPNLQSILAQYQREGIDLGVIPVPTSDPNNSSPNAFLQDRNAGFVERAAARTVDVTHLPPAHTSPVVLLVLLGLLGLLAAAYELALHPLTWRVRS